MAGLFSSASNTAANKMPFASDPMWRGYRRNLGFDAEWPRSAGGPQLSGSTSVVLCITVLALVTGAILSACRQADAPQPRGVLKVVMHPSQTARLGEPLKRAFRRTLPGVDVQIHEELLETKIVEAIQDERADVAIAYADVVYLAYVGQLEARPFDKLRGLATLNTSPIHGLVRPDSAIHDLQDIRGHRIDVGPMGSSTALTMQIVLDALGGDVQTSYGPFRQSLAKLENGSVDAIFAVGGYPIENIRNAIASGRARLLSLSESTTRRIRRRQPFVYPVVIPPGTYATGPILTAGIQRLLVCRRGLDNELAYKVTQAFFESLSELSSIDVQLRQMNVEDAPATAVPLHEGAARYYRQQEQL